ncbi:hypothetical protein FXV83_16315 [Bradyrhizobium hipponense]|uniref:Uncharacterized protein n=1 Tax=Bradyrhizobium hipponense TaxID=2605638 RepID=A0A5S4YWW5_9BRAD|nr:hypothetical protein [Bradyrhizobium hipponense]TYO65499.1 hypothetical protein FXV83_16315 [Bradyrhizobium hipponense]
MTTIAYKDGVLAGDTLMIKGSTITGHITKIVRRESDGALCGGSGNLNWLQAFHRWFLDGEKDDEMPEPSEYDNAIIARKDDPEVEIFEFGGSFVFEPNFTAIGSGKEYAFGAMSAGADAEEAIRIACLYDPGTGGEVQVVRHDG